MVLRNYLLIINGNSINMLSKLEKLVDIDNNKCTYKIEYPHYNKLKKRRYIRHVFHYK